MFNRFFTNFYGSSEPQADPDAAAFIAAAGITDPTQQLAIEELVTGMKSIGVWSKMIAVYPFVGGTATTHKYNLMDPQDTNAAYRMTFNGSWTHSSLGVSAPGGYADTHLFMGTGSFGLSSFSVSTYNRDLDVQTYVNRPLCCLGSDYWTMNWQYFIDIGLNIGLSLQDPGTEAARSTFATPSNVQRLNTWICENYTTKKIYLQKTLLDTNNSNPTGIVNPDVNWRLGDPSYGFANTSSFCFLGLGLTQSEYFAYADVIQAYQTTLGRQL